MHAPISLASVLLLATLANTQTCPSLGAAAAFGVVAASTVTNSGFTIIDGMLGLTPGSSVTGFPPGLSGVQHVDDAPAAAATADANTAYNNLVALAVTQDLSGVPLGGQNLTAGVYKFDTTAELDGNLNLVGDGCFVFQIGTSFTTGSSAIVNLTEGATANNVFFAVGTQAVIGVATIFEGNIIADQAVLVNTGASFNGGLYALTAAVTLLGNSITNPN
ncbi:hypothetical protein MMC12_007934 [Toensbergia leucococca]|nr:hypothetical protein [Toensbergia leucococca]